MDAPRPAPWVERSAALRDFPGEAADALLGEIGPDSGTRLGFVEVRLLDGAPARPPAVPNAVSGRNARWAVIASGAGAPDQAPAFREQLDALAGTPAPWTQDEMNANLLTAAQGATPDELRAAYGRERHDRFAAIKKRYDPRNLFRVNHDIVPA